MFYRPNGAIVLRHKDRSIISGQTYQTKLLSNLQAGYSCILVLVCGRILLFSGGISE
jgi:hypothetical protein